MRIPAKVEHLNLMTTYFYSAFYSTIIIILYFLVSLFLIFFFNYHRQMPILIVYLGFKGLVSLVAFIQLF